GSERYCHHVVSVAYESSHIRESLNSSEEFVSPLRSVYMSQTQTQKSSPAEATVRPSGLMAMQFTAPVCTGVGSPAPCTGCHTWPAPSSRPATARRPAEARHR